MNKEKKNGIRLQSILLFVGFMVLGGVCGYLITSVLDGMNLHGGAVVVMLVAVAVIGIAMVLQTAIHEAGHLVFGLLTGYHFCSYRIFSLMWVKQDGKIRLKRYALAGTGGQCLLSPPPMVNGSFPVVLYNLGGPLFNAIFGVLFLIAAMLTGRSPILSGIFKVLAVVGFRFALLNGIPMRSGTVDNDGRNALSLRKNPEAMRAFWIQMKISEQTTMGIRLKDMPEAWFRVPADEQLDNSMVSALGVFAANRLMDQHRLEEADRLMAHLLDTSKCMIGLYQAVLVNDRIYCELLGENRREVVEGFLTKEQCKLMKAMQNTPSFMRTQYACALLSEQNMEQAEKIRQNFEKLTKTYPYPSDLQGERELMRLAAQSQR